MQLSYFFLITLLPWLAWTQSSGEMNEERNGVTSGETTAGEIEDEDDPKYLPGHCHGDYEVCQVENCCNATFTCEPFNPKPPKRPLFAGEKQCIIKEAVQPKHFPKECHGRFEICRSLGCCDPEYVCAPYIPKPHRDKLFPCEYHCLHYSKVRFPYPPATNCTLDPI